MSNFGLVKSFNIDDGQLDGLSPQQCFVLGYELSEIDRLLEADAPIQKTINSANRERIAKACQDACREFKLSWFENDPSEGWMMLNVGPRKPPNSAGGGRAS